MPVSVPSADEFDALAARVYALEHPTPPPPPPPPPRVVYGASVQGGNPAPFEVQLDATLDLFRSYFQAGDQVSAMVTRATADVAAGRIPLMSSKVPYTWAEVGAGFADAWLTSRFTALGQVPGKVWVCLHHEPRGDGDPADWVRMQQRARQILDDGPAENVQLVGILNGYSFTMGEQESYFHPPGTGVHYMGFDSYNPWFLGGNLPWRTAEQVFAPGVHITDQWGYTPVVGEYGCRDDPANPGRASQWLRDAYAFAGAHRFTAISYFNSGANSPEGPWTLTGDRLDTFRDILTNH